MMKKIVIICSIGFSAFSFAQESADNSYVYEQSTEQIEEENGFPGNPGDPEPASIDDYVPLLLIAAVGLVICYRKKIKLIK